MASKTKKAQAAPAISGDGVLKIGGAEYALTDTAIEVAPSRELPKMDFVGARVVPYADNQMNWAWVVRDHIMRYAWALEYCARQNVVDLGCGTGYGSHMLAWIATSVLGIDIGPDAVAFARMAFAHERLSFEVGDIETMVLPEAQVYVCFEVLEHLTNPRALVDRLPEGSTLVWSIPVSDPGQFHKHVLNAQEIETLMAGSDFRYQLDGGNIVANEPMVLGGAGAKYVLGVLKK